MRSAVLLIALFSVVKFVRTSFTPATEVQLGQCHPQITLNLYLHGSHPNEDRHGPSKHYRYYLLEIASSSLLLGLSLIHI